MVSIAQIGVGYWGPNLLRNLMNNPRCEVRMVVDPSSERLKFVKRLYPDVITSNNVESIFDDSSIDAVLIATPVESHFDLSMKCLEMEKHILVEKPMARTVKEVESIGILSKDKNRVAMVGHTFLYNAAVRYVKKYIDSGELGDVRYIYSQRLNLGRIRSDVDALWNLAPHDISIVQYWLNDMQPLSVEKRGVDYVQKGINDVVFMNLIYPNKVMVNIHVSWLDPHKIRKMTVVGSNKMIEYDDISDNKIMIFDKGIDRMAVLGENMDFDTNSISSLAYRSGDILIPKINFTEPLKVEIDHFLDCIVKGTECITGIEHAKKVVEILAS